MRNFIILLGVILALYFFFNIHVETFTDVQNSLSLKLLAFFNSPPTNYVGYATILNNNANDSPNLAKITTYKSLANKGRNITQQDILDHI